MKLTCGSKILGEVPIKRGILQGDALSPLLFVIALIPLTHILRTANPGYEFRTGETINHLLFMDDLKLYSKSEKALDPFIQTVRIFSEDIGMQFGMDKCAMLVMKKGKIVKSDGIQLANDKVIKLLEEGESYKYLGVLEADEVIVNEMKDKVKREYNRRVRKVLETELNSGNVFKAINTWLVSAVRYSAAFLGWSGLQLEEIDRRTRKLHNVFCPKSNVDRLYLSRSEGGRGLIGVQDTVETAIWRWRNYVRNSKEILAACTVEEDEDRETPNEYKKRKRNEKKTQWTQKQIHGQFIRQTMGKASEDWWGWLRKGCLKGTTEALIMVAQEQAIRTNNIKPKTQENSKCRMCGKAEESVNHVLSECSKLAQKEYRRQHDWFGTKMHWEIFRKYGIEMKEKWYKHNPEVVMEKDKCKILRDFTIQMDHEICGRRPEVIVVQKDIIDFTCPYDGRVYTKELEKIEHYQDLA